MPNISFFNRDVVIACCVAELRDHTQEADSIFIFTASDAALGEGKSALLIKTKAVIAPYG